MSFVADNDFFHVLLETPTDSYVGLGFGPRVPGASMRGADVLMVALNRDGTPLVRDAYSQSDQLPPTPDVALNGSGSSWFDVHVERVDGLSRYWLSRARSTGDKWDNEVPRTGAIETLFSLGSVSLSDGDAADVLSTYHGAQRVTVLMEWSVSASSSSTSVPPGILPNDSDDKLPIVGIVLGAVGGALVLLIGVVLCAVWFVRRQQARDSADKLLDDDDHLVDGKRQQVPSHLRLCEMSDPSYPLALLNPSAGLFRDPVPAREYDEDLLFKRRAAQQAQQVTVRGIRLLAVEKTYCDILLLQNVSGEAQNVTLFLPPVAPQFRVAVEPVSFRIAPNDVQAVKVSVLLTCTTKQRIVIKASAGKLVADLPTAKVEAELSTLLDFDEIHLIERIGEGSYGVVFAGTWRKQAVAVKLLRQQQFEAQEQADLRAEAKLLTQLLHRNIVQFRGAVFRESQCCLVTELAPHGSLKSVLARFELPWDLVIKLCVDMASGVQFLHTSGIIHRDIKSDNVLVFSLSPRESVCAKLTDFGSARAGKAHIDATGQIRARLASALLGQRGHADLHVAAAVRAHVAPVGGERLYSLGVLFYEVASEREPWADVPFAWNVAKLVMAGQRPTWPEHVSSRRRRRLCRSSARCGRSAPRRDRRSTTCCSDSPTARTRSATTTPRSSHAALCGVRWRARASGPKCSTSAPRCRLSTTNRRRRPSTRASATSATARSRRLTMRARSASCVDRAIWAKCRLASRQRGDSSPFATTTTLSPRNNDSLLSKASTKTSAALTASGRQGDKANTMSSPSELLSPSAHGKRRTGGIVQKNKSASFAALHLGAGNGSGDNHHNDVVQQSDR
jgi:serine/threonine protein kinase